MATILENVKGRRSIRLNANDIIEIVREYQSVTVGSYTYSEIRDKLGSTEFYLPEDIL